MLNFTNDYIADNKTRGTVNFVLSFYIQIYGLLRQINA